MDTVIVPRLGEAPLKFQGELLADADGGRVAGREQNRYHCLHVWRTPGGRYVAAVAYYTRWQGEAGHEMAWVCDTPADVVRRLRDYDPTAHVGGYPPGGAYADKQARLLADIRGRYAALVSEVLDGEEFAEEVP